MFLILIAGGVSARAQAPAHCEEFVYLKDGRFHLDGAPYQFKGTNFHVSLGARVTNAAAGMAYGDYEWEYFIEPYASYFPDNTGICRYDPSTVFVDCCNSAVDCVTMWENDHVSKLPTMGVETVRLIGLGVTFDASGNPYVPCTRVADVNSARDYAAQRTCRMDLSTPSARKKFFEIVRQVVDTLGAEGVRTLWLIGGDHVTADNTHLGYLDILAEAGRYFVAHPYLIGYDFFNEPPYFYDWSNDPPAFDLCNPSSLGECKAATQAVTKSWFTALNTAAPYQLLTVGLGTSTASVRGWDPFVLYDHFTSWHVYPQAPWDEGEPLHGSRHFANQIYHASLAACGRPCPYAGSFDGANCLVAEGPPAAKPLIRDDGFFYRHLPGLDPCPAPASDDGADCRIGSFEPGRDEPFFLEQPIYYVQPLNGSCPSGTTFDGANCVVAMAPPGAIAFQYDAGAGLAFYYQHLPGPEPCRPPAWNDQANCYVAPVPAGHQSFILKRPLYYVTAVTCGPRKPAVFGEIGFAVYPDGQGLDPASYQPAGSRKWRRYAECVHSADARQLKHHASGFCAQWFDDGGQWRLRNRDCTEAIDQTIEVVDLGGGDVKLRNYLDQLCLGALPLNGAPARVAACASTATDQLYEIVSLGGGQVRLRHQQTGRCLASDGISRDVLYGWVCADPRTEFELIDMSGRMIVDHRPNGTSAERWSFLFGDAADNWDGVAAKSHACGFQGLHWWAFGDVHWGQCAQDNFGLMTYWYLLLPSAPGLDDEALEERPLVTSFRDDLSYTAESSGSCKKPIWFNELNDRRVEGPPEHTYSGRIVDENGQPMSHVHVYSWNIDWDGQQYTTFTNTDGRFELPVDICLIRLGAAQFGYDFKEVYLPTCAPGVSQVDIGTLQLQPFPHLPHPQTDLHTPDRRRRACLVASEWKLRSDFPPAWRRPVQLRHLQTGQCIHGNGTEDGVVYNGACGIAASTTYSLEDLGANEVRLHHDRTGMCLYGNASDGGLVRNRSCTSEDRSLVYEMEILGGDQVRLKHRGSGHCAHGAAGHGGGVKNESCSEDPKLIYVLDAPWESVVFADGFETGNTLKWF